MIPYLTYIKIALGAFLMAAIGFGGYHLGSKGKVEAELALEAYKVQVAETRAIQDKATEDLKQSNKILSEQSEKMQQRFNVIWDENNKAWTEETKQKDGKIVALQTQLGNQKKSVQGLTELLAQATDEAEKAKLRAQIAEANAKAGTVALRLKGLECLAVPIPDEYIAMVNAYENASLETSVSR